MKIIRIAKPSAYKKSRWQCRHCQFVVGTAIGNVNYVVFPLPLHKNSRSAIGNWEISLL